MKTPEITITRQGVETTYEIVELEIENGGGADDDGIPMFDVRDEDGESVYNSLTYDEVFEASRTWEEYGMRLAYEAPGERM